MKALLLVLLLLIVPAAEQADPEHPLVQTSSQEFVQGTAAALKVIQASKFEEGVETPGLGASSNQDLQKLIDEINAKSPMSDLGTGDRSTDYDVILQPGHYLRTSGVTGTHGKYVSERSLVAYITNIVATSLRRTGESVLVVSADNYLRPTRFGADFNGLHSKVFLAIHADGNDYHPCSTGPSLGYQKPATAVTMNLVALGLADALGYEYGDFRKNFTANEAKYYMFRQVQAGRLTGILEVGELTCQKSEQALITSSHAVGANVARAIDFIVRTPEIGSGSGVMR